MVQRQSQEFELNVPGAQQVQSAGGGKQAPNLAKFAPGQAARPIVDDTLSSVVGILSKGAQQVASAKMNRDLEMTYLEGAAAAQAGEVEDQLETNPLTRDWKLAGFRDTNAKVKMAEIDSRLAVDMKSLREQDPTKFREYLAAMRNELMPSTEGMSADARRGLLVQRLTWERQAIAQHGAEYSGYIIQRKQQAQTDSMRVQTDNMTTQLLKSGGDPNHGAAYIASVDSFVGQLHKDVILDPTWDDAKRGQMVYEAAHYALASEHNHILAYERLKNTNVTFADGSSRSMLSLVPADKLEKLSTDYLQAKNNMAGVRMEQSNRELAGIQARVSDELGANFPSAGEISSLVAARQTLDPKFNSTPLWDDWSKANIKRERNGAASTAYMNGNVEDLRKLGLDEGDGLRAAMTQWTQRGISQQDQAAMLLNAGTQHGMKSALGELGKRMSPTFANLGVPDRPVDAAAMNEVTQYMGALERASAKGRRDHISELTVNMPEDVARKVNHYRAKYAEGGRTPEQAWIEANSAVVSNSGKTPQQRAAESMVTAQDRNKLVGQFQPMGWAGAAYEGIASVFSRRAGETLSATPVLAPFTANGVQDAVSATMRREYAEELDRQSLIDPNLSGPGLDSQVKRALALRSIPVKSGALFLPQNMDRNALTGGVPGVDNSRIGRAIDSMYPPNEKGGHVLWKVEASGGVTGVDYTRNGEKSGKVITLAPTSIAAKLQEMDDVERRNADTVYGGGKSHKDKATGATVNYNGRNDAAVQGSWMLGLRDDLVRHEGVRDTPYDDKTGKPLAAGEKATGKATVGVGVAEHNKQFYPTVKAGEKVSQVAIDESFKGASNAAANAAVNVSRQYRLQNSEPAFRLLGSMAYHGGTNFASNSDVREMLAEMSTGREVNATQALKQTPQYKNSGKERQQYYENLVREVARR